MSRYAQRRCFVLPKKSLIVLAGLILISQVIAGCSSSIPSGTYVWIDVPQDGISFSELQPVMVEGHATGGESIERIEVYVGDELWRAVDDPVMEDNLARFEIEWLPPSPGVYTLRAIAYDAGGEASEYDETTISIGLTPTPVITVTPVISVTPTLTETPTLVPPPEPSVQFWADPETINAGDCTDIHWLAENVQSLIFGGEEQPLEGVFTVCLCGGETYSLTVIYTDDSEEVFQVNIAVEGTCEDDQPPPAPALSSPLNGAELACTPNVDLVWNAVSDETGISQYQVRVQRHPGTFMWTDIPGSVFTGITSTEKNVNVECGWYYRWQVLAVDGASNVGPWSSWWQFTVNLE